MPIDPTFAVKGTDWSVGSVGGVDDASSTGAAGAASGSGFGGMLAKQIGQLDSIQQDAATASQQLATGQATDPSATVMTIERARLVDAARLPDPHEGRRGPAGSLPYVGLAPST